MKCLGCLECEWPSWPSGPCAHVASQCDHVPMCPNQASLATRKCGEHVKGKRWPKRCPFCHLMHQRRMIKDRNARAKIAKATKEDVSTKPEADPVRCSHLFAWSTYCPHPPVRLFLYLLSIFGLSSTVLLALLTSGFDAAPCTAAARAGAHQRSSSPRNAARRDSCGLASLEGWAIDPRSFCAAGKVPQQQWPLLSRMRASSRPWRRAWTTDGLSR